MTFDEIKRIIGRSKPGHEESDIQQACVRWFRLAHPECLCFAVPNGGRRDAVTGAKLKGEGVMAGVSDLVIVAEGKVLFIEMKTRKGRQQESQKEFQRRVETLGHKYIVCRSLDDFMEMVGDWVKNR